MKIVHLIYSFNTGGAQTMLVDIANEQVKKCKVSVIIINRFYDEYLMLQLDKRINVYFINRKAKSKNPFPLFDLNLLLLRLGADVLHCHNHNIVPLLLPFLKKRTVLTLHCLGIPSTYLREYKQLFAISNSVKDNIISSTNINSIVVYNGISPKTIKIKQDYIIDHIVRIVCVGRLEHEIKGQHLTIQALHLLKESGISNIQLDFIGSGSSEHYLKELTDKYCLTEQVTFLGIKDRNYIYDHLKVYHIFIQPSLFEGFGLTVAEGMAAKVPVLISDVAGPMEVIGQGKYGYYFKSGDVFDLSKKIIEIIDCYRSGHIEKLTTEAYEYVKSNFDITQTVQNYFLHYK